MRRLPAMVLAALVLLSPAPGAAAQGVDGVVAARQAGFKQMGKAARDLARELRSPSPDLGLVRASTAALRRNAQVLPRWFPRESGPMTGRKTSALPAIWTDPAGFRAAVTRFSGAANAMELAGRGTDIASMRNQMKALGDTCAACHRNFRHED